MAAHDEFADRPELILVGALTSLLRAALEAPDTAHLAGGRLRTDLRGLSERIDRELGVPHAPHLHFTPTA